MNMYEKAFAERITQLRIPSGPTFEALTREALEGKWGGEGDRLLTGLDRKALEDPGKLAAELLKVYGDGAMQYLTLIVKYAESGNFHPEEDREQVEEEEELESIVDEVDKGAEE